MLSLKQYIRALSRELSLFRETPRAYLYTFTYPTDKKVTIQKYDPQVTQVGIELVEKIQKKLPTLKVHFVGSAALHISGQKDIDLLAESASGDLQKYLQPLVSLLGQPTKNRRNFLEWHIQRHGCTIELIVADSSNAILKAPIATFRLLKTNKKLLRAYEQLKFDSDGLSIREYNKRRLIFFNKILK